MLNDVFAQKSLSPCYHQICLCPSLEQEYRPIPSQFFLYSQDASYFSRFTAINFQNPLDVFNIPWYFPCKFYWFCGLVQTHPQDVVVFILNTASPWIIPERSTAPQHTRFILPPIHPTKSIVALLGRYFSLWETYLENFISRPDVIPTFRQRRCKTGAGTSFGANGDPLTWAAQLLLIFAP